ncbi:MAG: NERD domain-containing protein [Chloroflexi bacterium]|nr:NERD domain-containing protein [Chloroflexota bacterium]
MQVLTPPRIERSRPRLASIAVGITFGTILLSMALAIAYLVFATPVLSGLLPSGRPSATQLAVGMLAWTFALAAPAAFALLGAARLASSFTALAARKPKPTPAFAARAAFGDDHAVAVSVRLPDTTRPIDELVIGPFGAAVIESLPPATAARHHGRQWELRGRDGRWRPTDNPLERAARDAESVRRWFTSDDSDHVVKVFAAVVGTDPRVERTSDCAYIGPGEVAAWIAGLPTQRMLTPDRRERILGVVRRSV